MWVINWLTEDFSYSWYIIASVVFPIVFYIPKWFELTYEKDVPRACYRMNAVSHCLSEISEKEADMAGKLQVENINKYLLKLMSIFCWSKNDTITEQASHNISLKYHSYEGKTCTWTLNICIITPVATFSTLKIENSFHGNGNAWHLHK